MSKEQSTIIKGVAILMMLFYHLFNRAEVADLCSPLIMIGKQPLVHYISQACYPVTFFLILSGYGLSFLYTHNRLSLISERKRLISLYIHYWLILLIFIPIAYMLYPEMYKYDTLHLIGNVTAIRCNYNGEAWFLFPYAIICLTALPVIRYISCLDNKQQWLLTVCCYGVLFVGVKWMINNLSDNILLNILQTQIAYYVILLFYFVLGIILFRLLHSCSPLKTGKWYIYALLLGCLVVVKSMFKITIADGLYALLFIVLFLRIPLNSYVAHILHALGRHSMPMWLTHTFYCAYLFSDFIYGFRYPLLIFLALVTVSYMTAIPVMWLGKKILNS